MTLREFGTDVLTLAEPLADAYVAVFNSPPWSSRDERHADPDAVRAMGLERLEHASRLPGFRALLDLSDDGVVDAFAFGALTEIPLPTTGSHGLVRTSLGAARAEELLAGRLELRELGVRPTGQGGGRGRRLLGAFTATAPDGKAWLLTWRGADATVAFYRKLGWWEPTDSTADDDTVLFLSPG